jgi:hypothetical protein
MKIMPLYVTITYNTILMRNQHNRKRKHTTQRTGELRTPRKNSESDSIDKQRHSALQDTIHDDKDFEEMDTELSQLNMEGTRKEVRPSPKKT